MKSETVFALDNASWPALLVDGAGTVSRANAAAVKIFGAALDGESPLLSAVWSPDNDTTPEEFLAHWERTPTAFTPLKFRGKGGSTATYLTSVCALHRDEQKYFVLQLLPPPPALTEVKNANVDAGIAHKQKLECALQLARTVSLDFNNALTSILGHTSLVLSKMEPDHPWRSSLMEVEKSAAKAAEIANDLGTFSRQEKESSGQTSGNLNLLLQRAVESFQNSQAEKIAWSLQLARKLYTAKFEEAKMQQAFMKILENAVQALSRDGRITVQSRNLDLTAPTQDRNVRLVAGSYVCAEITDSGCGIAPDILPRIFEPFFTTKKGGQHRGLGLAWVYGIVTNHGGGVAVSSQPGVGTSVRVYLPAEKKIIHDNGRQADDLKGSQTILMVDDEELLLTMGKAILSSFGYQVLTANSGQRALEILSQERKPVDLLLTDLVMPGMSGRELVEQVRLVSPTTRILCSSGYVWPSKQEDDTAYLQKPFTSRELLVKVKNILTAAEPTSVD